MNSIRSILTNLILTVSCVLITASAFGSMLKSQVKYLNPNGCRVFTKVVAPDCPYEVAPNNCLAAKQVLQKIGSENPALDLKTQCVRIHTGNPMARALAETLMSSTSYDGYAINIRLQGQQRSSLNIETVVDSPEACALGVEALLSFNQKGAGVTASCLGGTKLAAMIQF